MAVDTMSIAEKATPHTGPELTTEPAEALGAVACSTDQGRTEKDREEDRSKNGNRWGLFALYCPPDRTDWSFSGSHRKPCRLSPSHRQVSHSPPSTSVTIFTKPEPHSEIRDSGRIQLVISVSDEALDVFCAA